MEDEKKERKKKRKNCDLKIPFMMNGRRKKRKKILAMVTFSTPERRSGTGFITQPAWNVKVVSLTVGSTDPWMVL